MEYNLPVVLSVDLCRSKMSNRHSATPTQWVVSGHFKINVIYIRMAICAFFDALRNIRNSLSFVRIPMQIYYVLLSAIDHLELLFKGLIHKWGACGLVFCDNLF